MCSESTVIKHDTYANIDQFERKKETPVYQKWRGAKRRLFRSHVSNSGVTNQTERGDKK